MKMGKDHSWWGSLLEKSVAKYFGTYGRMRGTYQGDALNIFSSQPLEYNRNTLSVDDIWKTLLDHEKKGWIMYTSCFKFGQNLHGVVHTHAYGVLGAQEYKDPAG
jgi:hypothetical protein